MVKRYYRARCSSKTLNSIKANPNLQETIARRPELQTIMGYDGGYFALREETTGADAEAFGASANAEFKPFIPDGKVAVFRFTPQGDKVSVLTFPYSL